jgi:uncharacterized membrane protein YqiK
MKKNAISEAIRYDFSRFTHSPGRTVLVVAVAIAVIVIVIVLIIFIITIVNVRCHRRPNPSIRRNSARRRIQVLRHVLHPFLPPRQERLRFPVFSR